MSQRIRSFIAVDIDDPVLVDKIARIQLSIADTGAKLKLVERKNFHITLKFLGEIPQSLVDRVIEALKKISFNSFYIELKGVGAFPSLTRPRVIWIGVSKGFEELKKVHEKVEKELSRIGFPRNREEFVAHLTIARVKGSYNLSRLSAVLRELQDIEVGEFKVSSIRLKKSTLTPRGPIYSTLYEQRALQ